MKRICLGCCEIVEKHINENHNGIAIHYGQDWYCGPVISVADDIADGTLKQIKSDREANDWNAELAAEQLRAPDVCSACEGSGIDPKDNNLYCVPCGGMGRSNAGNANRSAASLLAERKVKQWH